MEIRTERIEIPVGDARMGAYLARPKDGASRPGVIVWMEIFGVNGHIRDVAERVAREGYIALAPDFFHRSFPGLEVGYDPKGMEVGMKGLASLDADSMLADARAAVTSLRAQPGCSGKLGAMGFCIGGHMTYLTACETDIAAAASFYGGGIAAPKGPGGKDAPIARTPKLRGKLLCLFGGKDALIPASQVDAIRKALADAKKRHEVVVYPDADHGFFCNERATYHAASAADAWQRVTRLFAEELR
jgi:carboxymethylenebutenolidase